MTIKEIEYLKSGSYVYLYDRWLKLSYNDEYRIVYTNDPFFKVLALRNLVIIMNYISHVNLFTNSQLFANIFIAYFVEESILQIKL